MNARTKLDFLTQLRDERARELSELDAQIAAYTDAAAELAKGDDLRSSLESTIEALTFRRDLVAKEAAAFSSAWEKAPKMPTREEPKP